MYKILVRYYYIEYSDEAHPGLPSAKNAYSPLQVRVDNYENAKEIFSERD